MLGESSYRVQLGEEERRQLVLEIAAELHRSEERRSFGVLAADWLKRVVRVRPQNEERHVRHMGDLLALREPGRRSAPDDLTKAAIESCFATLDKARGGKLGPAMLNKLRSTGRLIVEDARDNQRWFGPNPFSGVRCRRVPRKPWPRVTSVELGAAFAWLRADRQREALVMIHMGMRPGELKALKKEDVDFKRGFVSIHRSLERDETKTAAAREVPIPDGCRAALEEAISVSRFSLVFPRADGSMQRADTKLSRTLRTAFKSAGVVIGYRLLCRRPTCRHREERAAIQPGVSECPKCGFALWVDPIPKPFTWYGLRHASATLHREFGADALAVKTALGWVQRDIGDDVYTHLSDERYRAEMNRLAVPVTKRVQESRVNATLQERRKGFEPSTPSLGSSHPTVGEAPGLGFEYLLTTLEVAAVLQVSTDTVYRLLHLGELPGVRILSGLRFHPLTIEDFVRRKATGYDGRTGTGRAGSEADARRGAGAHASRRRSKLH